MPAKPILRFPDQQLNQSAMPVTTFDDSLVQLADDLRDTMRAAPGIGITACHIGILRQVAVIELDPASGVRIYVNPRLVGVSDTLVARMEGSISMPGIHEEIVRPDAIRIAYRTVDGGEREEDVSGLLATCLQHEMDQLNGIFWLKRLSRLKRDRAVKRFEKLGK